MIRKLFVDSSNYVHVQIDVENMADQTVICAFDGDTFRDILDKLIEINSRYGQTSSKSSGKVKKIDLPEDMMKKCHGIIHTASVACGGVGAGFAQIPGSDNAVIVPVQIGMVIGLGTVFNLNITESVAKSIIASASATIVGRTLSQLLVGWIPGLGNAINTATAAGVTEVIGWIAVNNFYERWIEDKNKGRLDGMKDGFTEASDEYEKKLRKQAECFLNQMKDVQREREEYDKLLSEYENYIKELESKCMANERIEEIKELYNDLKKIGIA